MNKVEQMKKELTYYKYNNQYADKTIFLLLIFCFGCFTPKLYQKVEVFEVYDASLCSKHALILAPDLYMYNSELRELKKIHEFENYPELFFRNDTLVVISEAVPYSKNKVLVFNLLKNSVKEYAYSDRCVYDGGLVQYHYACLEKNLKVYWGCLDNLYSLDFDKEQVEILEKKPEGMFGSLFACDRLRCNADTIRTKASLLSSNSRTFIASYKYFSLWRDEDFNYLVTEDMKEIKIAIKKARLEYVN